MDGLWLLLPLLVVGGATSAYQWARSRHFFERRRSLGMRRSDIASAADGPVRIQGTAATSQPLLTAPISGQPCIFYDVLVETLPEPNEGRGASVLREVRGLELTVDDGTGTARVVFQDTGKGIPLREGPRHLYCIVDRLVLIDGAPNEREAARIEALLVEHGLAKRGALGLPPRNGRVSEGLIRPGDVVSVTGVGAREISTTGVSTDYRTPPAQYVIRAAEQAPVTIVRVR